MGRPGKAIVITVDSTDNRDHVINVLMHIPDHNKIIDIHEQTHKG